MKHAIDELEGKLEGLLDRFCLAAEGGDVEEASRTSAVADDFAAALSVLKRHAYGKLVERVPPSLFEG